MFLAISFLYLQFVWTAVPQDTIFSGASDPALATGLSTSRSSLIPDSFSLVSRFYAFGWKEMLLEVLSLCDGDQAQCFNKLVLVCGRN